MSDQLKAYEAGLAESAAETGRHPLHPLECRQCQRPIRHLGHDGLCDQCVGIEEAEDRARRREARRRLHRDTAMLLRHMGEPERAAWHDQEAERD